MIELSPLVATTKLSIGGRGNSPTLKMRLHGEALENLGACLERNAQKLTEASETLLQAAIDDPTTAEAEFEKCGRDTVRMYREVIDVACGDGTSGKVVKWIADGERIADFDLALRLASIVGWICEQYNGVFDGLSGQNIGA